MIVAGVGCRRGASAPDIEAAIQAALTRAGFGADRLDAIATIATKRDEAGLRAAAANLGLELVWIAADALRVASDGARTRSERVRRLIGVASVAEAAALAAAGGAGGNGAARLICPRIATGSATCAIAVSGAAP